METPAGPLAESMGDCLAEQHRTLVAGTQGALEKTPAAVCRCRWKIHHHLCRAFAVVRQFLHDRRHHDRMDQKEKRKLAFRLPDLRRICAIVHGCGHTAGHYYLYTGTLGFPVPLPG